MRPASSISHIRSGRRFLPRPHVPVPSSLKNVALAGRGLLRRRHVDEPLDRLRFRLDTFPRSGRLNTVYQPLPWLGLRSAKRAEGTLSRWAAIARVLDECAPRSALDIGCNRGFFTLSLATRGIPTTGVESDPPAYRTALYAIRKAGVEDAGLLILTVRPGNVHLLPAADAVLFLSLWHHFVREHGLEGATSVLEALWDRTNRVLFFDTGESEMPESYGLPPMTPEPCDWLAGYLARTCTRAAVVHLGQHEAFGPDGNTCLRNLFAVIRRSGND